MCVLLCNMLRDMTGQLYSIFAIKVFRLEILTLVSYISAVDI